MTVEPKRAQRRRYQLPSGPIFNVFLSMLANALMTSMQAPKWAAIGLGALVWLLLEVHRDLVAVLNHLDDRAD